jgi:hypothetical protein
MGARFMCEDGPEDVCGGPCNVDCLKPWVPDPRPAKLPPLAQHHKDRLNLIRAEFEKQAEMTRKAFGGLVL